jgi:2-hydroxycyclohexanecarboxyl-CoA dehydrogenase
MLDLQDDALDRESARLRATGAKILARKVDVSERDAIAAAYDAARAELAPISIVIANAGLSLAQDML